MLDPNFQFHDLRPIFIRKKDGRDRIICIPTVQDRLIQRLVLEYLVTGDKLSVVNPVSYGFRRGSGVQKAIATAKRIRQQHQWALKSDIQSFFDRIDRTSLKDVLRARLRGSSVVPILLKAIDCEIRSESSRDKARIEANGIQKGTGLRQGMPLSPLLSNVELRDFDLSLLKAKIHVVRYADDFVVFADSNADCKDALQLIRKQLAKKGHSIPDLGPTSKTQIYDPDTSVEFLGLELRRKGNSYQIAAPNEAFDEVKYLLEPYSDYSLIAKEVANFGDAIFRLNSSVNGFLNAYRTAANFTDLSSHAVNCRRSALEALLTSIFGKAVLASLDDSKRSFLRIIDEDVEPI